MLDVFILPTGRPYIDLVFADLPGWVAKGTEVFADRFFFTAGGSFNIAANMHKLGLDVGFCAHLGTDLGSHMIRQEMKRIGLAKDYLIEHDNMMIAVTVSISDQDDRAFLSYIDPTPSWTDTALPDHGTPSVVFIPGIPDEPASIFDYIDKMKAAGSVIVCDSAHIEHKVTENDIDKLMQRLDVFICNEKEALALTGRPSPERSAVILGKYCPEVVVKMGKRGALTFTGGLVIMERPIKTKTLDTTGAGDGFNAGYLYGICEGMLIERRLRLGNVVGGMVVQGMGGHSTGPSLKEALRIEKENYGDSGIDDDI